MAFALERRATGELTRSTSVGDPIDALAWDGAGIPAYASSNDGPYVIEQDDVRIVYAPIRTHGRVVAVLGAAFGRLREFDQNCTLFLDTVAAMLELRLSGHPLNNSTQKTFLRLSDIIRLRGYFPTRGMVESLRR